MTDQHKTRILARVDDDLFEDRGREVESIVGIPDAISRQRPCSRLVLGARHIGKTEILRKAFDELFMLQGPALPIYYSISTTRSTPDAIAGDLTREALKQAVAFRTCDYGLVRDSAKSVDAISSQSDRDDLPWVRELLDRVRNPAAFIHNPFSAVSVLAAGTGLVPVVLLDNLQRLVGFETDGHQDERSHRQPDEALFEFIALQNEGRTAFVLTGLERPIGEILPADEDVLSQLESMRVERLPDAAIERVIRTTSGRLDVEISDSTAELMAQQLGGDLFYIRAILDRAAADGTSLRTFVDFEKVYAGEVLKGRIGRHLAGLLRVAAREPGEQRCALEVLRLLSEADGPVPLDTILERASRYLPGPELLIRRLHSMELLNASYGFVAAAHDSVVGDYVRAIYRDEVVGSRPALTGEELLRDKLKGSYRLMMSRFNRSVESQLLEALSHFDFQSVPASLLNQKVFEELYHGSSRMQIRRGLEQEESRARLPQMVLVKDAGAGAERGMSWRFFFSSGFEGGIYSESNEVVWLIALINAREPLDEDSLKRVDSLLDATLRRRRELQSIPVIRWYISKEGFSRTVLDSQLPANGLFSNYLQLDFLHEQIERPLGAEALRSSDFELVIPVENETELIAARTAEQIARAAEFDQESINQIKTALIEACINAAEHGESPDRRIYQRFALTDDRLIITVRNKGKIFGLTDASSTPTTGVASGAARSSRGRGLQIIRALMDEVHFERSDDGVSLVMTKFLKRPENP